MQLSTKGSFNPSAAKQKEQKEKQREDTPASACDSHTSKVALKHRAHVSMVRLAPSTPCPNPPLLELLGRDEAGPKVGVTQTLSLPPGRVVLAHHLQHLPALERQPCLLAGDGAVLVGVVVEQGPHEHLQG